ncbi:MAG: hypothetical protein K2N49_00820, partial [Ruminococcus sp.]|nr:hypothetical protein [Ruminococcus sp.]
MNENHSSKKSGKQFVPHKKTTISPNVSGSERFGKPVRTKNTDSKPKPVREISTTKQQRIRQPKEIRRTPVRIIPLGGLNEIGKNMTVFECSNDIFIQDLESIQQYDPTKTTTK